jgi:hypothetical protein
MKLNITKKRINSQGTKMTGGIRGGGRGRVLTDATCRGGRENLSRFEGCLVVTAHSSGSAASERKGKVSQYEQDKAKCIYSKPWAFSTKSKLCYYRRSVGRSVLVSSPHMGPKTRFLLLSEIRGFVDVGHPP